MVRAPRRLALLSLVWIVASGIIAGRAQAATEYQVKAAFLYNFAKFVEWPDDAFAKSGGTFIIGVVGDDPFGSDLDDVVSGKSIDGHRIEIRRFHNAGDLRTSHILFICRSERSQIGPILRRVGNAPTLTVADTDGFLGRGGMINFLIEDSKVRFEINPSPAHRAGLKISSKLLQLARR
jgi:hypothetical protein